MRFHFLNSVKRGELWTPAKITTALWLDASDSDTITLSGSKVVQWDDKSGNARHAEQPTDSLRFVLDPRALNGLDVLDVPADHWMQGPVPDWTELVIIAVARFDSPSGFQANVILDTADAQSFSRSKGARFDNWNGDARLGVNGTFIKASQGSSAWLIHSALKTDGSRERLIDATVIASDTQTGLIDQVASTYTIGRFQDSASGAIGSTDDGPGDIAEIVAVNGTLPQDDFDKLHGYIAHKWGLEANLPSGHPYKNEAPTV